MKRAIWTLAVLGAIQTAVGPEIAMAANCVGVAGSGYVKLDGNQVRNLVSTSVACNPAGGPPWINQEYHVPDTPGSPPSATGTMIDYKKGPSSPGNKDPSTTVGSYSIDLTTGMSTSGQITYTYPVGGTQTFVYKVFGPAGPGGVTGGNYDFCLNGSPPAKTVEIKFQTGAPAACP